MPVQPSDCKGNEIKKFDKLWDLENRLDSYLIINYNGDPIEYPLTYEDTLMILNDPTFSQQLRKDYHSWIIEYIDEKPSGNLLFTARK